MRDSNLNLKSKFNARLNSIAIVCVCVCDVNEFHVLCIESVTRVCPSYSHMVAKQAASKSWLCMNSLMTKKHVIS